MGAGVGGGGGGGDRVLNGFAPILIKTTEFFIGKD